MNYLCIDSIQILKPRQEDGWEQAIPAGLKRRSPRIWQMAYVVTRRLLDTCTTLPGSIVAATALGALDETRAFLESIYKTGFGSPRNFISSVHNSMAGKLAIEFKIPGPNLTLCDGPNSLASALVAASLLDDDDFPLLLLTIDEQIDLLEKIKPHLSLACRSFLSTEWEEAAAAMMLTRKQSPARMQARGIGPITVRGNNPEQECRTHAATFSRHKSTYISPKAGSNSSVAPCEQIAEIGTGNVHGTYIIATTSPSANSYGLVELCV
ncbi:MAG: hypothetical protein GF398_17465 [Chitinivibrionales bacterium]|nr:hypothetical protein [Chitinivibrionales bacterium]